MQTVYFDVLMGNVSPWYARRLEADVAREKKRSRLGLALCAAVFAACVITLVTLGYYDLLDAYWVYTNIGLIAVVCGVFSLVGLCVALSKLDDTLAFAKALKHCRPDSRITSYAYREYNLRRADESVLNQIESRKFTADEAKGILNLAEAARASNIKLAVYSVLWAVIFTTAALITPPYIMAIKSDIPDFKRFMLYAPRAASALLALFALRLLWLIRHTVKYIGAVNGGYIEEYVKERERLIDEVFCELRDKTRVPSVKLTAKRGAADVFSSKLGGVPYLPQGFVCPGNENGAFFLLAQLNFEQLPKLPDFPETGILQFYIAGGPRETEPGAPAAKEDFRVVYHRDVLRDETKPAPPPEACQQGACFPCAGEFALCGELDDSYLTPYDCGFDELAVSAYNKVFAANETELSDLPNDIAYLGYKLFDSEGHRIGGYPGVARGEEGETEEWRAGRAELLLRIEQDNEINRGDSGTAHFFIITQEDLRAGDFSGVTYIWDYY